MTVFSRITITWLAALIVTAAPATSKAQDSSLLFHLSADRSLVADTAQGDPRPNFRDKVSIINDGARGAALSAADDVVLAWNAPGNIYAQRGTLSFYWRSRYPVGEGPFPIFRVGYADHTSWDMVWLRIDWNGSGFDAFVTDANLARTRVTYTLPVKPAPETWTHLAFTWDETRGVELYVDGKLAAKKQAVAIYDSGLDQFGPTSRVVSPHQVQSRYNFLRGGDYDELRIYDHALEASEVADLAAVGSVSSPKPTADAVDQSGQIAWRLRYGWNRPKDIPPVLSAPVTTVRKIEFTDARDLKQWMWKAADGIAETTWPGVYNRSRLAGRDDYLPLPDWNVYVEGGKALTLTLPREPWNYLEVVGAAFGEMSWSDGGLAESLAKRSQGQERTFHLLEGDHQGGTLTFTNAQQETPIQEISAFRVEPGTVPTGTSTLTYTVRANAAADNPNLDELRAYIRGRHPRAERSIVVALPEGAPSRPATAESGPHLPLVHILIPFEFGASPPEQPLYRSWGYGWENMVSALDGIAIDLPAMNLKPTHGTYVPLNIQVKDPIWPGRNLIDVSVAVKPGEARTLWLDTRDRILPNRSLYLAIAGAGMDFDASALDGARIRLVFKPRAQGREEHVTDRLNQLKDNWGFLVEEHTASKREGLYRRLVEDATDLFRVDPENRIGREYWADITYNSQGALDFVQPVAPKNVPLWAFRQLEDLKQVHAFVSWWIDNRQVAYGDFGGGLSDDTDLLQQWPGLALMGVEPDRIRASQMALADAVYANGMFTNGLPTIATDELHTYEEGINSNSQAMYLNWGDPKVVERLMTTVKALQSVVEINPAGHMHFVSAWFSGSKVYRERPWDWSKDQTYLLLHPAILMAQFNGDDTSRRYVVGLADGLLAHATTAGAKTTWPVEVNWSSDAARGTLAPDAPPMQVFWAAYRLTGDSKYLAPLNAVAGGNNKALASMTENVTRGLNKEEAWGSEVIKRAKAAGATNFDRYLAWDLTGDKTYLEALYGDEIRAGAQRFYSQTEGHWWSDRVELPSELLQRSRLGGVALKRNWTWPGATVSWRFDDPAMAEQVALLVSGASPERFKVIAHNTADHEARAAMTGWNVAPGEWKLVQGPDIDGDDRADRSTSRSLRLEKGASVDLSFPAGQTSVLEFERLKASEPTQDRPDLGIGPDDVKRLAGIVFVTVHSLGSRDAPTGQLVIEDASGKVLATKPVPALKAPSNLEPQTATVWLKVPKGASRVRLSLSGATEITQMNNAQPLSRDAGRP